MSLLFAAPLAAGFGVAATVADADGEPAMKKLLAAISASDSVEIARITW